MKLRITCWPYSFPGRRGSNHVDVGDRRFLGAWRAFQLLRPGSRKDLLDDGRLGIGVILNMIPLPLRER